MLIKKLNQINTVLKELINITKEDIDNIKKANHEKVFANITKKENFSIQFQNLKNEIDSILVNRNKPITDLFNTEEEKEFEKFKELLNEFNDKHQLFAKLSFSVTNFYNALLEKITNKKKVTYDKDDIQNPFIKVKA